MLYVVASTLPSEYVLVSLFICLISLLIGINVSLVSEPEYLACFHVCLPFRRCIVNSCYLGHAAWIQVVNTVPCYRRALTDRRASELRVMQGPLTQEP